MYSLRILQTLLLALILIGCAALTKAEVPQLINYQGQLTGDSGNPVATGPYLIKFKIYGSESGDDSLWSCGFQTVQVTGGLLEYKLGSSTPLPNDLFTTGTDRFLGITVGVDPEISPRSPIVSVPYAIQAKSSDNAVLAQSVAGEPGLSSNNHPVGSGIILLPSVMTDIVTTEISIPEDGYIFIQGQCNFTFDPATGGYGKVQIDETPGGSADSRHSMNFGQLGLSGSIINWPVSVSRVYEKPAGTYEFRLEAFRLYGADNSLWAGNATITAIFFPTAYGEVNAPK